MSSMPLTRLHVASRVAASLAGGYAFVWGFATFGISLLVAAGMAYDEARTLIYLLAFLVFLAVFCWAFAAASLARVWAVLAGGGAAMTGAAWAMSRSLS
ncbi:iron uptake protein [Variovorax sp. YR752]|uniref:iron uptake protein n=1 Tax=Variovorax sp. YR752 TaxID=1884383 RepID=UPI00313841C2